jgi:hypothetical protein
MVSVKSKILFLTACLLETVWLLLAQVIGSVYLLLPCLAVFVALTAWSAIKGMALPVLLYFLPFSSLLKIRPGTISLYTVALLAVFAVYIVLGSRKIRVHHLIPGLLLIAFVLVVKTVTGDPVGATFLVFAVSILAAPFLVRDFEGKYDFYWLTLFFALGIIVAAITSRYLAIFPTIARFIRKLSISGITRHSGYFNDPNFYAAHITAAMSGILILFLSQQKKIRMAVSVVGLMLLAFCGFLSVSKSFLLIVACVVIMWFLTFLFQRGKLSVKITWIMTMLVGVAFLLSATVFTDLIDMMLVRFGGIESLSDLTTHRSELWMNYLREFDANPIVLFFGKGCSTDLLNGRGTHNTLLQIIYQLGIVGGVVLAAWGLTFIKTILEETKIRWDVLPQIIILLIGCVGPWMGLDYFFQDEFFLMPLFVCAGIRYMCQTQES